MAIVKTAVSLEQELFRQTDALAASMKISRSRVVALALEDFLRRRRSDQITQQINEAYNDIAENEDREVVRRMRLTQRRRAEVEW